MSANESSVDNGEVARRAYEIWESRGCPPGDGMEDWNSALAELLATTPAEGQAGERLSYEIDDAKGHWRECRRIENGRESGIRVWFARVGRKLIGRES